MGNFPGEICVMLHSSSKPVILEGHVNVSNQLMYDLSFIFMSGPGAFARILFSE